MTIISIEKAGKQLLKLFVTKIFIAILSLATLVSVVSGIELISETPTGNFQATIIRVEHNSAMLFEPDTSRDTLTVRFIDCSDLYFPIRGADFEVPSNISEHYSKFHALDTNDSLLATYRNNTNFDFYAHTGDSIVYISSFSAYGVYYSSYLELVDSFVAVFRIYRNMRIDFYNYSNLSSVYFVDSITASPMTSIPDIEDGLVCHSNGISTWIYSLNPADFLEPLGYYWSGCDWVWRFLDIDRDFIFTEGYSIAYLDADTIVAYEWNDPGYHEDFGAPFEIWFNYIIKAEGYDADNQIDIAFISDWYPYPVWTWIDTVKGGIFEIKDSLLYTFGNDTLRIYNLNSLTVIGDTEQTPSEMEISINPNPFNSSTNIRFTIEQTDIVEAAIYNLLGVNICELINDRLSTGTYTLQWNAEGFPSGIYFCRLKTGKHQEVKRLLLIR